MKELMLLLASVMEEKDILERMKEELDSYLLIGGEDTLRKLKMSCQLFLTKSVIEHSGGIDEALNKMNMMEKADNLLNPEKS